jgi:hypothetical protein
MQQAITGLGIDRNKNNYPNRNRVNEMPRGRPSVGRSPIQQRRHQESKDLYTDEELDAYMGEDNSDK